MKQPPLVRLLTGVPALVFSGATFCALKTIDAKWGFVYLGQTIRGQRARAQYRIAEHDLICQARTAAYLEEFALLVQKAADSYLETVGELRPDLIPMQGRPSVTNLERIPA